MSEVVEMSSEVTTAEVAAMSSEELRRAVGRGRRVDEFEKEIGLVKRMNQMLIDQINEVKAELSKEKEKKGVSGIAHENGRLEENPEDDELPALRLANESLLTRQFVLEAQLSEAARYNDLVSSELSHSKSELKTLRDHNDKFESKNRLLQFELQQLQDASLSSLQTASSSQSSASFDAISKLQDENRDLVEKISSLEEKCSKRKSDATNLRSNVQFLKSKISELTSKLQSNEAVNGEALQRLKEQFASDAPEPASSAPNSAGFGAALSPELSSSREVSKISISGILDTDQATLLENASAEISGLLAAASSSPSSENTPLSIREYFNSRLSILESMKGQIKPIDPSAPLVTITEHDSGPVPVKPHSPSPFQSSNAISTSGSAQISMNWHEFDAAFLVLSVMLLQKLGNTHDRLARKRREYSDLQEDFNEFKRSQTQTARSGAGSRKMSAETQQITLQKKMNDLEKSVQTLTASSTEKEGRIGSLSSQVDQLTSELTNKTSLLEESSANLVSAKESFDSSQSELIQLQQSHNTLLSSFAQLDADHALSLTEVSNLSQQLTNTMSQLQTQTEAANTQNIALKSLQVDLDHQRGEIAQFEKQVSRLSDEVSEKTSAMSSLSNQLEKSANLISSLEGELSTTSQQLSGISQRFIDLTSSNKDTAAQLLTSNNQLAESEEKHKTKRDECHRLTLEVGRLSSDLHTQSELLSASEAQLSETKRKYETTERELANERISLEAMTNKASERQTRIDELMNENSDQLTRLSQLEVLKRELESAIQKVTHEASQSEIAATAELLRVTLDKDSVIKSLEHDLESSKSEASAQRALAHEREERILQLDEVLAIRVGEVSQLSFNLEKVNQELLEQVDLHQKLEQTLGEVKDSESNLSKIVENLTKNIENLKTDLDVQAKEEASLKAQIAQLSVKAKELEAYQKKMPEIADEALEAEERAVTKWLEFTLNKEKATTSSNPIAALASQLSLGTHSPGSAAMNMSSGMVSRKIARLADAFRHPSFLASIINLIKKDAFSEQTIKKLEEMNEGGASEAEILRCFEDCLSVGRSHGLRANGVTGPLLLQGNRRTLVDISLEVIRMNIMVRINIRAHPELSILYAGKDEKSMENKHGERLLQRWVNTFIEDFNQSLPPGTPPRPLITNLGKDLSDGKALGILLAAINPSWSALADVSSGGDLPRRVVKELAQAAFMRIIPPFLDSPLPILRGDETVLPILLAQLLEFNTGLSSSLAKDTVASTTSSTAYMLSATTPSRNQVRAVSGKHMTESPLKTPSHPRSAIPGTSVSDYTIKSATPRQSGLASSRELGSGRPDPNQVTVKPVEEARGWKFW